MASLTKLSLKFAVALLIMVSSPLVGAQTLQTLCLFNSTNGANPWGGLTLGSDGNFYGTTFYGGSTDYGTVFQVATNGTLTTLVCLANTNGANPAAGLTLGNDGNFYGTTLSDDSAGDGTVFKMTADGTLTSLVSFNSTNGANPWAELTLGNDGDLYGTTAFGGITISTYPSGFGTVFKVTTNGTVTTLVAFNKNDGARPQAALTLGNDGNFYGTTQQGGMTNSTYPNGMGTVFRMTTNDTLTTLVSFANSKGAYPSATLTLGNDGNFYGTTAYGGSSGYGTVFQVTTNGTLATLVAFNNTNGAFPFAGLVLANDGNLYGTTEYGGSSGYGTVVRITTNGALTSLVSFNFTNGANPRAGLTLGNDGNFYGTTRQGGITNSTYPDGMGTVFRLLLPPAIAVQPQSQTNNAGATVAFLVSATSLTPIGYQWQKNGTNLVNGGSISGATTDRLTITSISSSDAASYSVVVSNSYGSMTSSIATLTVIAPPVITAQPTNLLVLPGTNVTFGVSLTGSAPFFRYQWRFNDTNLLYATNAIYTIPSASTNKAGNYCVVITNAAGSATSSIAALTVVLSPKSQTNYASSTATFTVTAFSPELLSYQWRKNGTNLIEGGKVSGTTTSTLTIASVSDADAAIYNTVVSDASSSVTTSNAVLTVNDYLFIASQPQSQTVGLGSNVTFNITVYGAPPFIYQWYFRGTPLGLPVTGTNVSSCTLTNVGANQAGNYSVEVVSGYGSLMSSNALLTVIVPPTLALQLWAGYPLLNLNGMLSSNFVVQYSTNLAGTHWVNLLSLTNLPTSPYLFLDPAGDAEPARFYRAFMR
jgi:uncharacterized repeat protein (TIGR03803 family)